VDPPTYVESRGIKNCASFPGIFHDWLKNRVLSKSLH
jgi:hypothetical protein